MRSGKVRDTIDVVLKKFHKTHKDRYDYSKFQYVNSQTKAIIICKKHGEFLQTPSMHIQGQGCKKCAEEHFTENHPTLLTTELFIKKSQEIQSIQYDYSKVDYINSATPVIIICKKHGDFSQTPRDHMRTHGCKECANETRQNIKYTLEEFINKSKNIHNNKYDYSRITEYVNVKTKVCIICHVHGDFWQTPNMHLLGQGCIDCSGRKQHTTESFIQKSIQQHGTKYDYSKVTYTNNRAKVVIICPKHGKFEQVAKKHMEGSNCPMCFESNGEKLIATFLDNNSINYIRQKTFNDCRSIKQNKMFPFDFYIPQYNLIIEYDGKQHFQLVYFRGVTKKKARQNFKQLQINDSIKNKYCYKNNINLLRIPYTKIKDAEKIILKRIKVLDMTLHSKMIAKSNLA